MRVCKEVQFATAKMHDSGSGLTSETHNTCGVTIIYRVHNGQTNKEVFIPLKSTMAVLSNKQKQDGFCLPLFDSLQQRGKN